MLSLITIVKYKRIATITWNGRGHGTVRWLIGINLFNQIINLSLNDVQTCEKLYPHSYISKISSWYTDVLFTCLSVCSDYYPRYKNFYQGRLNIIEMTMQIPFYYLVTTVYYFTIDGESAEDRHPWSKWENHHQDRVFAVMWWHLVDWCRYDIR